MTEARQLDVEGLRFGGVGPVDLWLAPRECLALGGPSGAGKSRLLRAIADLDVHEGRVACQGTTAEALEPSEWRRRVGMLAADSRWWRDRSANGWVGIGVSDRRPWGCCSACSSISYSGRGI